MNRFLSILLICSFLISQEPCVGECFSDEEIQNIELHITELEQTDNFNVLEITNLKEQIELYNKWHENDSLWISLQNEKIQLLDERILLYKDLAKAVEPKWYENKWLYFFGGVIVTTQSIKLAGELAD
mgnify:CR=1 FL=1